MLTPLSSPWGGGACAPRGAGRGGGGSPSGRASAERGPPASGRPRRGLGGAAIWGRLLPTVRGGNRLLSKFPLRLPVPAVPPPAGRGLGRPRSRPGAGAASVQPAGRATAGSEPVPEGAVHVLGLQRCDCPWHRCVRPRCALCVGVLRTNPPSPAPPRCAPVCCACVPVLSVCPQGCAVCLPGCVPAGMCGVSRCPCVRRCVPCVPLAVCLQVCAVCTLSVCPQVCAVCPAVRVSAGVCGVSPVPGCPRDLTGTVPGTGRQMGPRLLQQLLAVIPSFRSFQLKAALSAELKILKRGVETNRNLTAMKNK
ncbi:uncharacterized protein LOC127471406 [Manacus candei]|uniref:uncharacterized protein LOC127471406 n=1 Tax=Manacus candei TaxID=415023 RepID=UPI0022277B84|nr:uncharacterized protein LOC127471406 [Manacus candei]